jgi:hypothetical protein
MTKGWLGFCSLKRIVTRSNSFKRSWRPNASNCGFKARKWAGLGERTKLAIASQMLGSLSVFNYILANGRNTRVAGAGTPTLGSTMLGSHDDLERKEGLAVVSERGGYCRLCRLSYQQKF